MSKKLSSHSRRAASRAPKWLRDIASTTVQSKKKRPPVKDAAEVWLDQNDPKRAKKSRK